MTEAKFDTDAMLKGISIISPAGIYLNDLLKCNSHNLNGKSIK